MKCRIYLICGAGGRTVFSVAVGGEEGREADADAEAEGREAERQRGREAESGEADERILLCVDVTVNYLDAADSTPHLFLLSIRG